MSPLNTEPHTHSTGTHSAAALEARGQTGAVAPSRERLWITGRCMYGAVWHSSTCSKYKDTRAYFEMQTLEIHLRKTQ